MDLRQHPDLLDLGMTDEEADLVELSWAHDHPKTAKMPVEEAKARLARIRATQADIGAKVPVKSIPAWQIALVLAVLVTSMAVTFALLVRG